MLEHGQTASISERLHPQTLVDFVPIDANSDKQVPVNA